MIGTNIPGTMYDSWIDFLPPEEENVQKLILEREDTKQRMSLSLFKGSESEFEQNLCIVLQDAAWHSAGLKVLRVWTKGLQHFSQMALPLVETLQADKSKVLPFFAVRNYTVTLATMVRFMTTWNSRKGMLEAVANTRSSLAKSQFMAPFKESIAAVQALFDRNIHPSLSLGLKFEAIELYAKELVKRPKASILPEEIAWVKETKVFIEQVAKVLPSDPFLNQRLYASSTIDELRRVISHVNK